jgi:hypothetical protein
MIIGISGRISSGKDTVGNIVQYIVAKHESGYTFPDTEQDFKSFLKNDHVSRSNWQIKKFAGKVKEICSILTSIPTEDFEKQEVKDRVLGEEWYRNKIIPEHGYWYKVVNWDKDLKPEKLTVRQLLQQVATDAMRNIIHPDVWVNALFANYGIQDIAYFKAYPDNYKLPNWIITDTRFPNEVNAITDRNGILIRVNRKQYIRTEDGDILNPPTLLKTVDFGKHLSETALDSYPFTNVIDNDGTIKELIEQVRQILIKYKII